MTQNTYIAELAKLLQPKAPDRKQVWEKAHKIDLGHELAGYRRDDFGNLIRWEAYGDRTSPYGWEIDHIIPSSLGGAETLDNLRPLKWLANVHKSDTIPSLLELYLQGSLRK